MDKSLVRKIALGFTVLFDVAMLTFWALAGHWGFFWCFITINAAVIIWEIINSLWLYGKTLSTEAKHKIEESARKRAFIYLAIIFMCLSIGALAVHLGWV